MECAPDWELFQITTAGNDIGVQRVRQVGPTLGSAEAALGPKKGAIKGGKEEALRAYRLSGRTGRGTSRRVPLPALAALVFPLAFGDCVRDQEGVRSGLKEQAAQ